MTLRIAIFGATGAAGSGVLRECLEDPRVAEVVAVTRRPLAVKRTKLREVIWENFLNLQALREEFTGVDACFWCLGISQTLMKDPAKYREITHDYTLAGARALREASPGHVFHFVSGQATNINSRWMWARVKAETERDLGELGLAGMVCWRPSYIRPMEQPPGRPFADRVMWRLYPLFRGFANLSVSSADIGRALLLATVEDRREGVVENREIRALAERYRAG